MIISLLPVNHLGNPHPHMNCNCPHSPAALTRLGLGGLDTHRKSRTNYWLSKLMNCTHTKQ